MKPDASIVTPSFPPEASAGRYDYLREVALDYAFLLAQLGICE